MEWIDINKVLASVKLRPKIKDKLKEQIIREYLQKKRGVKDIVFRQGNLEIKVKSSVLLQELFLEQENLKKEINNYLKEEAVRKITLKRR